MLRLVQPLVHMFFSAALSYRAIPPPWTFFGDEVQET
jgi:hypothetical protein